MSNHQMTPESVEFFRTRTENDIRLALQEPEAFGLTADDMHKCMNWLIRQGKNAIAEQFRYCPSPALCTASGQCCIVGCAGINHADQDRHDSDCATHNEPAYINGAAERR